MEENGKVEDAEKEKNYSILRLVCYRLILVVVWPLIVTGLLFGSALVWLLIPFSNITHDRKTGVSVKIPFL